MWPSPHAIHLVEVNSGSPIGPRACSFWVEMPISAPKPNCSPSVNAVDALTITAAAVDSVGKPLGRSHIGGHDGLGVSGAVFVDVGDCGVDAVHHGHRDVHRKVFAAQVVLSGVQMHRHPGVLQGGHQPGHGVIGDRGVDQQRLGGVADTGPAGLGVQQDPFRHLQVGAFVHVDVTVADTGLDGGHLRVADHRVDQARSAARDDHVDQAAGLDEVGDGGPIGGRKQLDRVGGQVLADQRVAQHVDECLVGLRGRRAAAQQHGVTGLERQTESVDGDVGPALVDHADHAERNPLLAQMQPIGQGVAAQHLTDRVGQPRDLAQTGGDPVDALRVQRQPIEHRGGCAGGPGGLEILGIGRKDPLGVGRDGLRRGLQRMVLGDRRQ